VTRGWGSQNPRRTGWWWSGGGGGTDQAPEPQFFLFSSFLSTNLRSQIIDKFNLTIQNLTFNFLINSLLCHFKHVSYLKYS